MNVLDKKLDEIDQEDTESADVAVGRWKSEQWSELRKCFSEELLKSLDLEYLYPATIFFRFHGHETNLNAPETYADSEAFDGTGHGWMFEWGSIDSGSYGSCVATNDAELLEGLSRYRRMLR